MKYEQMRIGDCVYLFESEDISRMQYIRKRIFETLEQPDLDKKVNRFYKKFVMPASISIALLNMSTRAFAKEQNPLSDGLYPAIRLIQEFAFPLGVVVSSWALLELMVGNVAAAKEKLKFSIMGFVGMFLVPEVFYMIRDMFARDIGGE